jgi:hypothetical protein
MLKRRGRKIYAIIRARERIKLTRGIHKHMRIRKESNIINSVS